MFEKLLSKSAPADMRELLNNGAIIIDVRSEDEFDIAHGESSVNIPLHALENSVFLPKDKNKPLVVCCISGARSAVAKNILNSKGYTSVHNGGDWRSVQM